MKNKHRIKQGLSLLLAGGIALTNLGAALPAFAEDAAATPECQLIAVQLGGADCRCLRAAVGHLLKI